MAHRIHFTPQAWLNDHAISVDREGDTSFIIPAMPEGMDPDGYEFDRLQQHLNCPTWIREWSGPFEMDPEPFDDELLVPAHVDVAVMALADQLFAIGTRLIGHGFSHIGARYRHGDLTDEPIRDIVGLVDRLLHLTLGVDAAAAFQRANSAAEPKRVVSDLAPYDQAKNIIPLMIDAGAACIGVSKRHCHGGSDLGVRRGEACSLVMLSTIRAAAPDILLPSKMPSWLTASAQAAA